MLYLEAFTFPTEDQEHAFFMKKRANCYSSFYPFQILGGRLERLDFEPITILAGSNGSGKSTALGVIAEKLCLTRRSPYNKTEFYAAYVDRCTEHCAKHIPPQSAILTSDDVFEHMLDLRRINDGVDTERSGVVEEYYRLRTEEYSYFTLKSMEQLDTLKKLSEARRKTRSAYTRAHLAPNVRTHSNGETALRVFTEVIRDGGLYLLDEPENSLSPEKQCVLAEYLEESARSFGCQFILSTHSIFLLAMKRAKIYDFDEQPVDVKPWQELKVTQVYRDFFRHHEGDFLDFS